MSLLKNRTPLSRPRGYSGRIRETITALRAIRIDATGAMSLTNESPFDIDERRVSAPAPLRPSFAALQLYLLNEQRYGVNYIAQPDEQRLVANLRQASIVAGDILATDNAAAMTRKTELERRYPYLYDALRIVFLEQLVCLVPVPLSNSVIDATFRQLLATDEQMERAFGRLDRELSTTYAGLTRGTITRDQRDREYHDNVEFIVDVLAPRWNRALPAADTVVAVKMEQQQQQLLAGDLG